jgi:hypothetical protein
MQLLQLQIKSRHSDHLSFFTFLLEQKSKPVCDSTFVPKVEMIPHFDKVIVVVFENTSFDAVNTPFFTKIAQEGALLTNSYGITHPSQPNYMYLFTGDACNITTNHPTFVDAPNLYTLLPGNSFVGYAEDLPSPGSRVAEYKHYARKHVPWASFTNVPASANLPFSHFPKDYADLPSVSFVIPNLLHDIHDGSIEEGDAWLHDSLGTLFEWVKDHNSLIIITFDEDDNKHGNHIYTVLYGANIVPGKYNQLVDHVNVFNTILATQRCKCDEEEVITGDMWEFKCVRCGKRALFVEVDNVDMTFCGENCYTYHTRQRVVEPK